MKHKVVLKNSAISKIVEIDDGYKLLQCIREQLADFYAPCGGNGTCGKCRVYIPGDGHVTSCLYPIKKNIEVILPERSEMQVLSSQYNLTKALPLDPGSAAELVTIPYGLAVDIGTTTIVFFIVNLQSGSVVDIISRINPQLKFGADVITRINYGATTSTGLDELQKVLVQATNNAIAKFCAGYKVKPTDFVKISVVGNTTMLHNLLRVDALSIAQAPFMPQFTEMKRLHAHNIGININEQGELLLSPSLSAYVGADIVAGLASLDTSKLGRNFLFVDIGTNGELVLVTPNKILACATAAGPAFEGANISCGMPAVDGAISEFNQDSFNVIGGGEPVGVCGSGLIDVVATMIDTAVLGSEGNINNDFVIYSEGGSREITLNQQDVREVQLAKSAVFSGIKRLMAIAGLSFEDLNHVLLAGGFGNYLHISNAIKIGLLPPIPLEKYIQVGNAAGSGAVLALDSEVFITQMEELKSKMEYVDLSTDPEFPMEFAMNMYF